MEKNPFNKFTNKFISKFGNSYWIQIVFSIISLAAIIGALVYFAFSSSLQIPFLKSFTSKTYLQGFKPFQPNKNLAVAIAVLPSNKDLAEEKLKELQQGMSPANDTRRLYILAQINQRKGETKEALQQYRSIRLRHIPYLADRVLLHIAEISGELGDEKGVIEACNEIIRKYPHSLSVTAAHYELARSMLRQSKTEEAIKLFKRVKTDYPESQQAIGVSYYLGTLTNNRSERDKYWQDYLSKSPSGRFSADVISSWLQNKDSLNNYQRSLIGLNLYETGRRDNPETLNYLSSDINQQNWLSLGELQIAKKQKAAGQRTLLYGLKNYKEDQHFETALNLLLRNSSQAEINKYVDELINTYRSDEYKGSYILWRQAAFHKNNEAKSAIYKNLLRIFPSSSFASSASAEIFWQLYSSKNYETAIKWGQEHLSKYSTSRDSAKVMFWLAKYAESTGETQRAKSLYNQILNSHIATYYALRAKGRLEALNGGQDFGWRLPNSPVLNFSAHKDFEGKWVWPLPKEEIKELHPTLRELFSLNLWQEALTLLPDDYKTKYPALDAWMLARVEDKVNEATQIANRQLNKLQPNFERAHEYWLLSYPFVYIENVESSATRHNVDPLLVQGLMRQESRFQPSVVSTSNAIGLCQLLPSTAAEVAKGLGQPKPDFKALCSPNYNIELGTKYLSGLIQRFNNQPQLAVAAYNGGPGSVSKWLNQNLASDPDLFVELIPFSETQKYVINVFENYWVYHNLALKVYSTKGKFKLSEQNNSAKTAYDSYESDYPSTVE
ncbi:MAG: transglycosylase SLT domain-containing protein [Candidatus Caenarcaniphilales bacterium]|nr:transglycosylase SLT domain-containing protein [Candidatus Caenarcaniphilales bacterium]